MTTSRDTKKSPRSLHTQRRKRSVRPEVDGQTAGRSLELATLQGLRTIFGTARAHDAEVRRSAGVSGSQLWALSEIAHCRYRPGITVNRLSVQMALHQTTTSNLVNSLVVRGLIRRERDATDHRVVHLRTTTVGQQLLLQTPGPHAGLLVDALRHLKSLQLHQLSECLGWVIKHMRRTADTAAGETLLGE